MQSFDFPKVFCAYLRQVLQAAFSDKVEQMYILIISLTRKPKLENVPSTH